MGLSVTGAHSGRPGISGLKQIKSFREGSRFDVDASATSIRSCGSPMDLRSVKGC